MNGEEHGGNIVYILINRAMPGYVKIGRTGDLHKRMKSLYRTPVPLPFECVYACTVKDGRWVENWLFEIFGDRRVSDEREFFEVEPERVAAALVAMEIEDITPHQTYIESESDAHALEEAKQRRERFNFKMVDINPGAILYFSMDENITSVVANDNQIEFEGKKMSLTAAAKVILERMKKHWQAVSGPGIWKFEGETLHQRRLRMEAE